MADLNDRIKEQQRFERECGEVDEEIGSLRNAYEQYFLGLERKPPVLKHDALKRRLTKLRNTPLRNTVLKFKIGTLEQKFKTYERMWERTLKEIENGTYHRDLAKVRRKMNAAKPEAQPAAAPQTPETQAAASPLAVTQVPSTLPGPTQATVAVRPPTTPPHGRPATPPGGSDAAAMSEAKVKAIFDAYVTAKRRCQEDTSKLTLDAVASSLRKQVPELLKKHNAKEIDFKVVIKDGKAILRAVPR